LRMAPETITRIEGGSRIQSASYDLLMQLYLASSHVRLLVSNFHAGRDIFETVKSTEVVDLDMAGSMTPSPLPRVPNFVRFASGPRSRNPTVFYGGIPAPYPAIPPPAALFSAVGVVSHVGSPNPQTLGRGPPQPESNTSSTPNCPTVEPSLAP
jgi:hypothetical protein